jgi:hypothetical protein
MNKANRNCLLGRRLVRGGGISIDGASGNLFRWFPVLGDLALSAKCDVDGNLVFPFLSARLSPQLVTAYGMQSLASETGASSTRELSQLFPFVFLAATRKNSPGFWDFFGPTVLALAPLALLAFRNT